ncbi:flagellar basal body P-ring formation chaperone FlgA [Candidatus Symbiobacter mobilis]|nr:flagellar basal body P-ring formation chaperone FlgA [Candidatus Symbiobacter mobilis]
MSWRTLCVCSAFMVWAAVAETHAPSAEQSLTQQWLAAQTQQMAVENLRLDVEVGALDPRLRLAPCNRVEPYVPPGNRLWGRTRVGLRCVEGATRWNVFLPVTVRAWGSAWVIKGRVASGTVLGPDDAMLAEVDWAANDSPVLATQDQWLGLTTTRPLETGQALRRNMVKASQVFAAGAEVRVRAMGRGFVVTTSAQALSAGVVGQSARVRTTNGNILTGIVQPDRSVGVTL